GMLVGCRCMCKVTVLAILAGGCLTAQAAVGETWQAWTMDEVIACFGQPKEDVVTNGSHAMRIERDGCSITMDLQATHRLYMHDWKETNKGACRRLLHKCDEIRRSLQE